MTENNRLTHEQLIKLAKEDTGVALIKTKRGDGNRTVDEDEYDYELLITSSTNPAFEKPTAFILDKYLAWLVVNWMSQAIVTEKDGVYQRTGQLDHERLGPFASL